MNKIAFLIASFGACVALSACSTPDSNALVSPSTGKHAANWITAHPGAFFSDPAQCAQCHGSDIRGGISKVSCYSAGFNGMTCHPNGPGHADPAAFAAPAQHGVRAKTAPDPSTTSGFSTCQTCHGSDFAGGSTLPLTSCLKTAGCHGATVNAPHSVPWISTSTYHHSTTDTGNAVVCANCHLKGLNSPLPPPSPAGTGSPGCFNNTLCHGPIHPIGFAGPTQHGVRAKAAPDPSTTSGFSTCQTCHGSNFAGGTTFPLTSCLNTAGCHGTGVLAPHAVPWLSKSTYQHMTTDTGNAPVCANCHLKGLNSPLPPPSPAGTGSPGCFNNTLCHGSGHPVGFAGPTQHGVRAKAAPDLSTKSGFSTCQTCHGSNFAGGTTSPLTSCLNTAGCHGTGVYAPHAVPWSPDSTYKHNTTDTGNAPVCGECHLNGANSSVPTPPPPGSGPLGCFNGTLCHFNP